MSLDVSKTKHGELVLLAQRDGWGRISQYNLEKRRKQEERKTGTHLAQRDGWGRISAEPGMETGLRRL
jgi:hypothetical protein